jgi:hypothetical protein
VVSAAKTAIRRAAMNKPTVASHPPCGSILFVPNVTRDLVQPGTRCAVDHTRSRRNTGTNLPAYAFDAITKLCCRR